LEPRLCNALLLKALRKPRLQRWASHPSPTARFGTPRWRRIGSRISGTTETEWELVRQDPLCIAALLSEGPLSGVQQKTFAKRRETGKE
jgi:hypothetical protein